MNKRLLVSLLKYVLAFGLLSWVLYKNWDPPPNQEGVKAGLKQLWEDNISQGDIHVVFLVLAVFILALSVLITFCRWYILVRAVDLPFRLADALRLGMVGFFFNTFLPGAVGGDIIKAAFLAREQSRRTVAVATVIMDRAVALCALVWFVALSGGIFWAADMIKNDEDKMIIQIAALIAAASLAAWLLLGVLPPHRAERFAERLEGLSKVGPSAAEFWRAVWMYRCRGRSIAAVMLLSWVGHVGFVLAFYCAVRTIQEPNTIPTLAQHFLIVPIGLVVNAAIPLPGGIGAGELAFGQLYKLFGSTVTAGVFGSLVQRVIYWVLGLLGYLVYLRMRGGLETPAEAPTKGATELAAVEA